MPRHKNPADKVKTRGAARMKELGMKRVTLWFDDRELAAIAAAVGTEKVATWIRKQAFHAAEAELAKRRRGSESDRAAR